MLRNLVQCFELLLDTRSMCCEYLTDTQNFSTLSVKLTDLQSFTCSRKI